MRSYALGLALLAACGDDGAPMNVDAFVTDSNPLAPDATPREVITATQTLAPLQLVEGKLTGGPQDYAGIHLDAPFATIGWNIHGHENGGTQTIYEEFDKMEVNIIFVPTSQTDWWLLVRNEGQTTMDVQIRVELYGAMTWVWE